MAYQNTAHAVHLLVVKLVAQLADLAQEIGRIHLVDVPQLVASPLVVVIVETGQRLC